ncbi:DUF1684 domain-containing protein [uncultured Eudoraea sp.]|uniref:DUF1684 domain-containing protein n=1 Tax=uncultured Eudoraea sp. TaxID=1035614 RepID=UPI0026360734|nr:DUF1684 domain-containing protein [uncultured Eudoraea sp.]
MKKNLLLGIMCLYVGISGCADKRKYHDTIKSEIASDNSEMVKEILLFQKELNEEFKNPETSPLPDRYRKDFEGLDFFQPDTSFRVIGSLERTADPIPFMMPTTTDRLSEEVVFGVVNFSIKGENYSLEVYQNLELKETEGYEDYLFLPFLDNTNGEETYTGGRYLDLAIPEGNSIILDFNRAYNPYCAYNKKYSCPIVPKRNNLDTKIKAGVKSFKPKSNK